MSCTSSRHRRALGLCMLSSTTYCGKTIESATLVLAGDLLERVALFFQSSAWFRTEVTTQEQRPLGSAPLWCTTTLRPPLWMALWTSNKSFCVQLLKWIMFCPFFSIAPQVDPNNQQRATILGDPSVSSTSTLTSHELRGCATSLHRAVANVGQRRTLLSGTSRSACSSSFGHSGFGGSGQTKQACL